MVKLMKLAEEIVQDQLNAKYASMTNEEFFTQIEPEPVDNALSEIADKVRQIASQRSGETQ